MSADGENKIRDSSGNVLAVKINGLWHPQVDTCDLSKFKKYYYSRIIEQHSDLAGELLFKKLNITQLDIQVDILTQNELGNFFNTQDVDSNVLAETIQRIRYFNMDDFSHYEKESLFFVAHVDQYIVGMAKIIPQYKSSNRRTLMKNHEEKTEWVCLSFLSVDPEFRGQGIASKINEEIFRYVSENNLKLRSSSYSESGAEKLKPNSHKLAEKYGVEFEDRDMIEIKEYESIMERKLTEEEKKNFKHFRFKDKTD